MSHYVWHKWLGFSSFSLLRNVFNIDFKHEHGCSLWEGCLFSSLKFWCSFGTGGLNPGHEHARHTLCTAQLYHQSFSLFKKIHYHSERALCVHTRACVLHTCMQVHTTAWMSRQCVKPSDQVSTSLWVPGIKLGLSDLHNKHFCSLSHIAGPSENLEIGSWSVAPSGFTSPCRPRTCAVLALAF